jgi:DNA-binding SARP family transcriptional activator
VLGPLRVLRGGQALQALALGSRKQRILLACLLVTPNQLVSLPDLREVLWEGAAPPSVELTLRSLVSRLRGALGAGASNTAGAEGGCVVHGHDGGYLLEVDPEAIDSVRFQRLTATGRNALAAGQPQAAIEALRAG